MDTSRKAMKWLISFSSVNLMLGCLKNSNSNSNLKNVMNLVPCQKQLEYHQHILTKIWVC